IWNGLMGEHHDDYLVHDFLVEEPNPSPIYRGYAYPHIYNTYFMMYEIASRYPDMADYIESPDTYLMRAYNIMMAYYSDSVGYNWGTGVMGESTTPAIIDALEKEGHVEEAEKVVEIMDKKYESFKEQKYPYGSEYSYDNTGEEAVYVLAKLQKEAGNDTKNAERMMKAINTKTRACRGNQPVWYHYADPVTNCGENWWQFQYSASLIGYCMNDYLLHQDNEYESSDARAVAERMNYAAKLANLTCINSGQIDSDPENIGTVAWTYQAEMGNLGGQGTGGGKLHNGWRQMAGEADLGLFGALQILSADVSEDPVFGLFGYGCEVSEKDNAYDVKPCDGLYTKLNLIDQKFSMELKRDQYTRAIVNKDRTALKLMVKNLEKTAHSSDLELINLKKGSYELLVDGKSAGRFSADSDKTVVPVKLPAAADAEIVIKPADKVEADVSVEACEDITAYISDKIYISGKADDKGDIAKTPEVKWTLADEENADDVEIKSPSKLKSRVIFKKPGSYKFILTAVESGVSDSVTVKVLKDPETITARRKLISLTESMKKADLSKVEEGKENLEKAIVSANETADNKSAELSELNDAMNGLKKAFSEIKVKNNNLAFIAEISASYTSGWEDIKAVNDGKLPKNANESSYSHWGSWGNSSSEESLTYKWPAEVEIDSSNLYLWYDGNTITSGGIKFPKSYKYEYLDENGSWKSLETEMPMETDKFSTVSFDRIKTSSIRVILEKRAADGEGVGVHEWEIIGQPVEYMITPDEPETPDVPDEPETPETPETPEEPETPVSPSQPDVTEIPETPEEPETPVSPSQPDAPETPETPEVPETPEEPETPEIPGNPDTPSDPNAPETPSSPSEDTAPAEDNSPKAPEGNEITGDNCVLTTGNKYYIRTDFKVKKFEISDKKVLKVTKKGKVRVKRAGTVTITAKGKNGETKVFSNIVVEKPKLSSLTVNSRETIDISEMLTGVTYSKADSYASSNTKVAAIDANGKITINGAGKTKITVIFGKKKFKKTLKVRI
nr:Ig-like domain-containing protein [Lachnospiraceae bacterium]